MPDPRQSIATLIAVLAVATAGGRAVAAGGDIDRAAERMDAMRAEALALEHGEGVPRDLGRAADLYCQCARLGDAEARYRLGWMYANGRGVARDDGPAAFLFDLAARQGHADAVRMFSLLRAATPSPPPCLAAATPREELVDGAVEADLSVDEKRIRALVGKLSAQYGVKPRLVLAVIRTESNFDARAVSAKNAQGLMQLIPETAARFNVTKPFDPEQNIRGGLAYLRWLLAYFQGNVALVAAAYNAGEGAVNRFLGVPPFAETREYVKRIIELFHGEDHPYDPTVVDASPELPKMRLRLM